MELHGTTRQNDHGGQGRGAMPPPQQPCPNVALVALVQSLDVNFMKQWVYTAYNHNSPPLIRAWYKHACKIVHVKTGKIAGR